MSVLAASRSCRLRREREKRRVSQAQLARKLKVSPNILSEVEHGKREPWPDLARRLAKFYGVQERTIYKWYLGTVFLNRRPKLVGNAKLRFYPYPTTSDLDSRGTVIREELEDA